MQREDLKPGMARIVRVTQELDEVEFGGFSAAIELSEPETHSAMANNLVVCQRDEKYYTLISHGLENFLYSRYVEFLAKGGQIQLYRIMDHLTNPIYRQ